MARAANGSTASQEVADYEDALARAAGWCAGCTPEWLAGMEWRILEGDLLSVAWPEDDPLPPPEVPEDEERDPFGGPA
jgi:hypothetical protein